MGLREKFSLTNICKIIGEKNNPIYTVIPIAICKGICRPISTMRDKKQDPETKKYAAVREGLTELIAVPTYWGMSKLTEKLAPAFSPEGKSIKKILESGKTTLGFFGVCAAALVVIPGLCSAAMPHVLSALGKKDKETQQKPLQKDTLPAVKYITGDYKSNIYPKSQQMNGGGMRI